MKSSPAALLGGITLALVGGGWLAGAIAAPVVPALVLGAGVALVLASAGDFRP